MSRISSVPDLPEIDFRLLVYRMRWSASPTNITNPRIHVGFGEALLSYAPLAAATRCQPAHMYEDHRTHT
jgi:hypothetical protein